MRTLLYLIILSLAAACAPETADTGRLATGQQESVSTEMATEEEGAEIAAETLAKPAPDPQIDIPAVTEAEQSAEPDGQSARPTLDLSMPELTTDESVDYTPSTSRTTDFDPKPLFDKRPSNVSATVSPKLKAGEELTDMPVLEGGEVQVEVKTK